MNKSESAGYKLFRAINGPGDSGSELEWNCLNPAKHESYIRAAVAAERRVQRALKSDRRRGLTPYWCKHCRRIVWRKSDKPWYKSFCEMAGKNARMVRVYEQF